MGRALGKVMGIFTPSASAQKMMDLLPPDADEDLAVRRQDKKRGRDEYVRKEEEGERSVFVEEEELWRRDEGKARWRDLPASVLGYFRLRLTLLV